MLGNRMIVNVASKSVTTAGLFLVGGASAGRSSSASFVAGDGHGRPSCRSSKWVQSGRSLTFDWALRVDTLTAMMLVVINSVSALVHLYSWGYMEEDPDQPRFFAYLSACSPSRC
jgi:NADH-quinone oxidoreductase subunit L